MESRRAKLDYLEMTVAQLIGILSKYPGNMKVGIVAKDDPVTDIIDVYKVNSIVLDDGTCDEVPCDPFLVIEA